MSTLGELLREMPVAAEGCVIPIRAETCAQPIDFLADSIRDEQIHALVQQLFFPPEAGLVRNVGFTPVDESARTAALCLEIARTLSEEGKYDVGLIDASSDAVPLEQQLQIPAPPRAEVTWPVAPRLWFVPRQNWWREAGLQPVAAENLEQLREYMTGFDFSILWCAPVSWLTARIAQSCDGVVLVLTANKTRRLVAAQIKERLSKAHVPLLGTVLVERRFPIPRGLYRSL